MTRMGNFCWHIRVAARYGEWDGGFNSHPRDWMFGIHRMYYDGHWIGFRFGPLWATCHY